MTENYFWNEFLKTTNLNQEARYAGDFGFEAKGFAGTERIALILAGRKRAVFSSYATYAIDNEPLPVSDEYYIVKDAGENPVCIIKTTSVQILPFNEVTWEMASLEGEDSNLEEWREKTRENIEEEGEIVGFDFSEDIKLVFMSFETVFKRQN